MENTEAAPSVKFGLHPTIDAEHEAAQAASRPIIFQVFRLARPGTKDYQLQKGPLQPGKPLTWSTKNKPTYHHVRHKLPH